MRATTVRALAAALGALALWPAASQAATCAVGSGGTYLTIGAALADPTCTDIQVEPGTYDEGPLTLARSSTTVSATPGTVTVTGKVGAVLTVAGSDDVIRGLAFGGPVGLRVSGARGTVDQVSATGTTTGLDITGNAAKVLRSEIFGGTPSADALQIRAASSAARTATVDSSILAAGASGAGLRGRSDSPSYGDVTITAVHVTIAGSTRAASLEPTTRVKARATRSIVHGTLGGTTLDTLTDTKTADAALFRNPGGRDLHLRADAPVIDKDGPVGTGESDRDVDGEPRVVGAGSDLGADEFLNQAPTAALKVNRSTPRQNATITFDASGSGDPEAAWGGGLVRYAWDFGDGTTDETTTPTIEHSYTETGRYRATVQVVDAQGGATTSTPLTVRVRDGLAPAVRFLSPRSLTTVTGSLLRVFRGTAHDRNGTRSVTLSLRQTKLSNGRRPRGHCRYVDARTARYVYRSCTHPLFFKVRFGKGRWSYDTHGRFYLRPGRWQATIRAMDKTGNRGSRTIKFAVR